MTLHECVGAAGSVARVDARVTDARYPFVRASTAEQSVRDFEERAPRSESGCPEYVTVDELAAGAESRPRTVRRQPRRSERVRGAIRAGGASAPADERQPGCAES